MAVQNPTDAHRREEAAGLPRRRHRLAERRDSRSIETIGHYNPRMDPVEFQVDADKAKAWLAKGAQPSDTVLRLFRQAGIVPAAK
jgi:ribosomal protein S16